MDTGEQTHKPSDLDVYKIGDDCAYWVVAASKDHARDVLCEHSGMGLGDIEDDEVTKLNRRTLLSNWWGDSIPSALVPHIDRLPSDPSRPSCYADGPRITAQAGLWCLTMGVGVIGSTEV